MFAMASAGALFAGHRRLVAADTKTAENRSLSAPHRAAIDGAAATAMRLSGARGISVTMARDGVTLYARGFGLRDVAAALPVDERTVFPIGSITKQFTAAAVMLLVRDRLVDLDARAARYVSDAPHGDAYTVRQLLQQTTGLANYTAAPNFLKEVATSANVTPSELLAPIVGAPLAFAPGTAFAYSNSNYVVLGMLVERVARSPYGSVIAERIARPLGLDTLSFGPPAIAGNVTLGYERDTGATPVVPWSAQSTFAAGGLYASPADLVRWDEAFFGGRLLDAPTVRLMTTPPKLPDGTADAYAMGWVAETLDGHPMIWHNGGVLGANTRNAYFPEQRLEIVIFANSAAFDETPILKAAFRAIVPPTSEQLRAEAAPPSPAAGEDTSITEAARAEYERWRTGNLDLGRYTSAARAAFTPAVIAPVHAYLAGVGPPSAFIFQGKRGGMDVVIYTYRVIGTKGQIDYLYALDKTGAIAGIRFTPAP